MSADLEFEADIDRAIECVLRSRATPFEVRDFSSYGYDERQYCSPGFDLPVGSFRRTPHGEYTEYHTSADNLDFVSEEHLAGSLGAQLETIDLLESDVAFRNLSPNCEPQLGRRGLSRRRANARRWRSCGCSICPTAPTAFSILPSARGFLGELRRTTEILVEHGLLEECEKRRQ